MSQFPEMHGYSKDEIIDAFLEYIDAAGLRESSDIITRIGDDRAREIARKLDNHNLIVPVE